MTSVLCQWDSLSAGGKCTGCGYTLMRDYEKPPKRVCGVRKPSAEDVRAQRARANLLSVIGPQRAAPKSPAAVEAESKQAAAAIAESKATVKQMVYNYAEAVKKWQAAGCPKRSEGEIERIFAICKACEHFEDSNLRPHCTLCGCTCSMGKRPLFNKLAMATETECPDNPPRWVSPMPDNLVKSSDDTNHESKDGSPSSGN